MTPVAPICREFRNRPERGGVHTTVMTRSADRAPGIEELRSYAGRRVSVRLDDASVHEGELRTELLSERSISVFLKRGDHEGSTLYIHEIAGIEPIA